MPADVLAVASAPGRSRARTATTYSAIHPPVFDRSDSKRTYQLVSNDKNGAPHMLSCEGDHADALAVHNERAQLTFERKSLADDAALSKVSAGNVERLKTLKAQRDKAADALKAKLDALAVQTTCERTQYVTRGLMVYSEQAG